MVILIVIPNVIVIVTKKHCLLNPSKKFGNLSLVDHFSVVTVLLALNFISLESLFIYLYNDAPVVMNMHLWAEQHSWLCGWVPRASEMWKMSLPMCILLLVLTLLFWVEWGIGCVLNGTVCVTGLPVFSGGPPWPLTSPKWSFGVCSKH